MNDQLRTRVAWLYYMENLTQAEIAEQLGLTRARVNRTLGECRESGIVRITLNSRFESCVALEQKLKERRLLSDAVVIPTPDDPGQLLELLGAAAGEYLSKFIAENRPDLEGRVVMMTGDALGPEVIAHAREVSVVVKPLELRALRTALRPILGHDAGRKEQNSDRKIGKEQKENA